MQLKNIGGYSKTIKVDLDSTLLKYTNSNESSFTVPKFEVPSDFSLGVIYGSSGTGKTSLLQEFNYLDSFEWDSNKAISSQVNPDLLMRIGLSSIPSLCRPYHVLSTGEKHRADIAVSLKDNCVIDEFTSVCNRELAKSISIGLRNTIDKLEYKNIVVASCHEDIIEWVEPDWIINTNTNTITIGRTKRPSSTYRIIPCSVNAWDIFKHHHYLSANINAGAYCWLMLNDKNNICGFASALANPGKGLGNAWREHRLVILPDYQGLGLGSKLSNAIAQMFIDKGSRYFSKTAHPKLGEYRNKSPLWKPTIKNLVKRNDYLVYGNTNNYKYSGNHYLTHADRLCYSHEYIGSNPIIKKEKIEDKNQKESLF